MNPLTLAKIGRIFLIAYAVLLTIALVLGFTVGPIRDNLRLISETKVAEAKFEKCERERIELDREQGRLLDTIRKLQAGFAGAERPAPTSKEAVQEDPVGEPKTQ